MEYGPKAAICNHLLIIFAVTVGVSVQSRGPSCPSPKVASLASPSSTKATFRFFYLLVSPLQCKWFEEGLSLIN